MTTLFFSGKGSQQRCYEANPDCKFFVCYDKQISDGKFTKTFAGFKDHDAFFDWRKTEEGLTFNDTFYEQLTDSVAEIYDIDGHYSNKIFQNEDGTPLSPTEIANNFINARLDFQIEMEDFIGAFRLNLSHFLIKTTPDKDGKKASLHIIIRNGYRFKSQKLLKDWTKKFYKFIMDYNYKTTFDQAIYSTNRNIRLLGCHKGGQPDRKSTRLTDFGLHNETANFKLFCSSYQLEEEKFYDFGSDAGSDADGKSDKDQELENLTYLEGDDESDTINKLVRLIKSSVEAGEHTLCDEEFPNKMCYDSWKSFVFTIFSCCSDDDQKENLFFKVFDLYRHSENLNKHDTLKNMLIYDYKELTIKSLHYWARENPEYDKTFPEIKIEWENRQKIKQWNFNLKKASKVKVDDLGVDTIHKIKSLYNITFKQTLKLDTIKEVLKNVIVSVSQSGENPYFVKDQKYDKSSGKTVQFWSQSSYKKLVTQGGSCNVLVRYLNEDYLTEKEKYDSLPDKQKSLKKNKPPEQFKIDFLGHSKGGIMGDMCANNEFKHYRRVIFNPYLHTQNEVYKDCLNIFNPFVHLESNGDPNLYYESKIRNHIRKYLCDGDGKVFGHFENWFAHIIQKPDELSDIMIVFSSKQGMGKDMVFQFFESVLGSDKTLLMGKMDDLFGKFNTEQQGRLLIGINEISDKGVHFDKHDQLKHIITQKNIRIEPKGQTSYQIEHFSRYIGFSNKEKILTVENSDRRLLLIKSNNEVANNHSYFTPIWDEFQNNPTFLASAFKYFSTKNIEGYCSRNIPSTKYKEEQKIESLPSALQFIYGYFDEERKLDGRIPAKELFTEYLSWMTECNNRFTCSYNSFIKSLDDLGLEKKQAQTEFRGKKVNVKCIVDFTEENVKEKFKTYLR
jgi:hypothetical protein